MANKQYVVRDGKGRTRKSMAVLSDTMSEGDEDSANFACSSEEVPKKIKPLFRNCSEVFSAKNPMCQSCGRCQRMLATFDQYGGTDIQQFAVREAARKKSHCALAGPLLESGQLVTFGRCIGDFFSPENFVCLEECNLLCQSIKRVYVKSGLAHLENLSLEKGAKDICSCPDPELCEKCGICNLLQAREISSIINAYP